MPYITLQSIASAIRAIDFMLMVLLPSVASIANTPDSHTPILFAISAIGICSACLTARNISFV